MPSCIPCTVSWLSTADANLKFAVSNIYMCMSASVSSVARALHCQELWWRKAVDQSIWCSPLVAVADSSKVPQGHAEQDTASMTAGAASVAVLDTMHAGDCHVAELVPRGPASNVEGLGPPRAF